MYSKRTIIDIAKQLLAWSAIAMLFVQPLSLSASNCGCCTTGDQAGSATCCASTIQSSSCCGSKTTCCCSKSQEVNPTCTCGDQCRCSIETPGKPLPAVPLNGSQHEQTQTLALTISVVPLVVTRPDSNIDRQNGSVYRPALTAQQTCALLSRFIV